MEGPSATKDEIRTDIYEKFESRLTKYDLDDKIEQTIIENVTAEDPPNEFSDQLIDGGREENES